MSIDVDEIAPPTPELEQVAERRVHDIIKEWARRLHIWGTHGTHGPKGERIDETFSIRDLAVACYMQGSRDATTVAVMVRARRTIRYDDADGEGAGNRQKVEPVKDGGA